MNEFKVNQLVQKGDFYDIWEGIHMASKTPVFIVVVEKKGHIIDQERLNMLSVKITQLQLTHP